MTHVPVYRTTLVREGEMPCTTIRGPEDVERLIEPIMGASPVELFMVILLDMANHVIGTEVVSRGGLASSIVEPRAVFRTAVLANAASLICAHNHPSGNTEPSAEDLAVTRQLVEAGGIMGIPVRDHVIWTHSGFTSFGRRGLI